MVRKPDKGKSEWWKFLLVFLIVVGGLFLWSQSKAESITLTWDRTDVLQHEIWVDNRMDHAIYGRTDSAMIEVSPGKHCFKMRHLDVRMYYSPFSQPVCLETADMMEIHIPSKGSYI